MKAFLWVLLVSFAMSLTARAQMLQPNILFILADDLAWSDLGCYGHAWHQTPYLDALAQEGMLFTDAYAPAPICSASRASILTGKTVARLNFEFVTKNEPGYQQVDAQTRLTAPPFTLDLPLEEVSIAESLGSAGYETAFFGKWHLNSHHNGYLGWSPTHGPRQQGFHVAEEDFGAHPYAWTDHKPATMTIAGQYPADSMVNRVVNYLTTAHERPFFVMASSFFVHTPVRTTCQWLLDKYDQLVPTASPNRKQRIEYAAFVETLDHQLGLMLQALTDAGLRESTLVVFTSDNGGHPEFTANGPLRGSKWNLYEGGIRVPWIVRWPGVIHPGSTASTPVIGYDLLPTFVAAAGHSELHVDGISLLPAFKDKGWNPSRDLIWHFPYYHPERGYAAAVDKIGVDDFAVSKTYPQSAIRRGDDKLIQFYESDKVELYNLRKDAGEQRERSATETGLAAHLKASLRSALVDMQARFPTQAERQRR